MQIIQTFWPNTNRVTTLKMCKAGWLSPMFHFMSWGLSVSLLRDQFSSVKLFTNEAGKDFFSETLKFDYQFEVTNFSTFENIPKGLWSFYKMHVYSRQTQPFLHVDGDVFSWKDLRLFMNKPLVVQNAEIRFPYNRIAIERAKMFEIDLPDFVLSCIEQDLFVDSINAGIIGGSDIDFIQEYVREGIKFYYNNEVKFQNNVITNHFNCLIEQIFFYCLSRKQKKAIQYVLNRNVEHDYKDLAHMERKPNSESYFHPVGSYKRNRAVCREMSEILKAKYPKVFERCRYVFKDEYHYWFDMGRIFDKATESWINCGI